jgi:CheY-like chemotaxis protein
MGTLSILHIDDNQGDLMLAREALAPHGVRYEGIDEPVTAVGRLVASCAAGKTPTAILLDLNIGCMDGFDVLQLLSSNRSLRRIPVIVLTSSEREVEREKSLCLGAAAYLVKPDTVDELAKLLMSTLSGLRSRKRVAEADAPAALSAAAQKSRV